MCRQLLKIEGSLWTFARVEGVAPDNNAAERALRHGVIWRKTSGGTDSERGSRFVGQVLSVVATCQQRGRDVLSYLTECFRAHLEGQPAPSLLAATSSRGVSSPTPAGPPPSRPSTVRRVRPAVRRR